jgi:Bacterial regulatory protein, Fis family
VWAARTEFNRRDAARLLGISLASLYRKLSIEPPAGAVDEED